MKYLGFDLDVGTDDAEYAIGVATEDNGDFSLSVGKDSGEQEKEEEAPGSVVKTVTQNPYLLAGGVALALVVIAALLGGSRK